MELLDAINTNGTCRYYKTDPVDGDIIVRLLRAAQKGPSGSNRQPVQFIVVRDAAKRQAIQDLYLPIWDQYMEKARSGAWKVGGNEKFLANADHFAQNMAQVPVHVVVCFNSEDIQPIDAGLDRPSVVGGSSIYPVIQNFLLAARNEGLGTTLTTLLCLAEEELKPVLGIPANVGTAAVVTLGWPAKPFPKKLKRRPLSEITFADRYGEIMSELRDDRNG
ncbi:MAG: nitroreductase family protein [Gammaproteobacteria bacterium]